MNGNGPTGQQAIRRGDPHDELPYPSLPFSYTQPSRLAALASLFGVDAADAGRARVLELGCAAGGNIIPLAARFPDASFLGVDLVRRHIEAGRARIASLNLGNIVLREEDLATLSVGGKQFDYVICHGVFSWVPKSTQDAILRICRETLAPNGLAVISYNLLPGWHLRQTIRDICLYHAPDLGRPRDRVAAARAALAQIAGMASGTSPYGRLLRNEAMRLARLPGSYLLGEFLADHNSPSLFRDFVDRASQHGLSYLCEGDLGSSAFARPLLPDAGDGSHAISYLKRIAIEQERDFVTGRTFRRSILTRSATVSDPTNPDRLRSLHIASEIKRKSGQADGHAFVLGDIPRGALTTVDPAVTFALTRLAESYPNSLTLEQLCSGDRPADDAQTQAVGQALLGLIDSNQASVSTHLLAAGAGSSKKPKIWSVARAEAAARQPWVTTLRHDALPLTKLTAQTFVLLDGTRDRQALCALLAEAVRRGEIRLPEHDVEQGPPIAAIEKMVADHVEQVLAFAAGNALLEPE